jgi:hypothetical protein
VSRELPQHRRGPAAVPEGDVVPSSTYTLTVFVGLARRTHQGNTAPTWAPARRYTRFDWTP